MARTQKNLNRYRKIYPQIRKSPHWWIKDTSVREVKVLDLSTDPLTFTTTVTINSPVVVATAEGATGNINVWVATIAANGDYWNITIGKSDSSFNGKIHVIVGDSNP